MKINISDLSEKELLDCEYKGVRSRVNETLHVVEMTVRHVLQEYVLTKNDWDQISEIKLKDLFKESSSNDKTAVRRVKKALSEVDFLDKGLVAGVLTQNDITAPQLYTEAMRERTVNDLVFRTKVNGFYGCLFRPSTLPEGEEIVNQVAIRSCAIDWRIRVMRYRLSTTTGSNADYFAVEFLEGEKVIGVSSAAYVLDSKRDDASDRMVCDEVGDMVDAGLWLLDGRRERGGELIIGGLELAPEYRGKGLGYLLNYVLVIDLVQSCEDPSGCVLMADPLQYQLMPYDYIPEPIKHQFSADMTTVNMIGSRWRKELMDSLFSKYEEFDLKNAIPVVTHSAQGVATIQTPGRSLESSTDHIGVIH